jgi:hypothetical protein
LQIDFLLFKVWWKRAKTGAKFPISREAATEVKIFHKINFCVVKLNIKIQIN